MSANTSAPLARVNLRGILLAMLLATLSSMPVNTVAQTSGDPTAEPVLSAAETAAIDRNIATLHSSADRVVAKGWSNSKKVAETLCRPAAMPVLKKQLPGIDRVFLGTDDPKTLYLENNAKLTGTGSARTPTGWQDFTFTCQLDPGTGKAISFEAVVTGASQPAK
jgi:hypothetical protein